MSLTYYKPNSHNKGSLLSVNFSAKADKTTDGKTEKGDKSFYFKFIAQTSWDDKEKTGGFKDGKSIIAKMSPTEVAGILAAIARNTTLADMMNQEYIYHDGATSATTIYFNPAFKKIKVDEKWVDLDKQVGFVMRLSKAEKANKDNRESLGITLTYAETELLMEFLKDGLNHIFNALYSEDVSRGQAQTKKATKTAEPKAPVESGSDEPPASW